MKNNTRKLTESALMVALATVLNLVVLFKMVNGGSITLFSAVPIILVSYRHGIKWGMFSGLTFGIVQIFIGGLADLRALSWYSAIGSVFLDFLIPFALLGLGGVFRKSVRSQTLALGLGTLLACLLRFTSHFISGFVLWGDLVKDRLGAVLFSFTYNLAYMGPELVLTLIGCVLIGGAVDLKGKTLLAS